MPGLIVTLLVLAALAAVVVVTRQRSQQRAAELRELELAPVRKLAEEDITALGVELQHFDTELAGHELDAGANADYQRALDAYESAKLAGDRIEKPEDVKHITTILEDGRYAMACVRARVAGDPLPTRRPPCFFDPRHGLSVRDVEFAPPGGTPREVPACALDAERVEAGADPDSRMVMQGAQRVPYWQGGRAYQPYAAGYFGGFAPMDWMFMGLMFGAFSGFGGGFGGYDAGYEQGLSDAGGDGGDGGGDMGGDMGGDGGGLWEGFGDGGGMFDGF